MSSKLLGSGGSGAMEFLGIDFGIGPDKAIEVTIVDGKVVECRELGPEDRPSSMQQRLLSEPVVGGARKPGRD